MTDVTYGNLRISLDECPSESESKPERLHAVPATRPLFSCPVSYRSASKDARMFFALSEAHRLQILSLLSKYGDMMTVDDVVKSLDQSSNRWG